MKTLIRGQEKDIVYKDNRPTVDGEDFDGHRVLWDFCYEAENYLKESELSGDEWRKGGNVRFFRNHIQIYEKFCREPDHAVFIIAEYLYKLMEFNWEGFKEGRKIWYRDTPAVIDYIMLDQGAFTVKVDGAERFPDHAWALADKDSICLLEDPTKAKIDIFDHNIWWWRK